MKKLSSVLVVLLVLFLGTWSVVDAHVVVTPAEVPVAAWEHFSIGVPSEKPIATVGVRIVLPQGLAYITPNVKPGWTVETKKDDAGNVTEINWTAGRIPAGQRDEFLFSAKAPDKAGEVMWKAYQTYEDGSVVSWDSDPKAEQPKDAQGKADFSKSGPYSITKVVDDLSPKDQEDSKPSAYPSANTPITISIAALALAIIALLRTFKK